MHLRNAPVKGMENLGYGKGYKYAHNYEGNVVEQDYLPEKMREQFIIVLQKMDMKQR